MDGQAPSRESERHPTLDDRFDPAIKVVPYREHWPSHFDREKVAIKRGLGDFAVRIEHVGSTAVTGLASKPIIDIQVAVRDVQDRDAFVRPLERLGYLFAPDPDSPDLHFFGKPADRPRRYHVHVCQAGSEEEMRHLAVRDYLRSHREEAARYEDFKRTLVSRCRYDRLAYTEGKEPYMRDLERRAVTWQTRRSSS